MSVSIDAYEVTFSTYSAVRITDKHVGVPTAKRVQLNVHADSWDDAIEIWRGLGEITPTPVQESWHLAAQGSGHPTWFATVRARIGPVEFMVFPPHGPENRYTSAEEAVTAWTRANMRYTKQLVTADAPVLSVVDDDEEE